MDTKEHLKDMLNNLINGDTTSASEAVHQYIVAKSREIANQESDYSDELPDLD